MGCPADCAIWLPLMSNARRRNLSNRSRSKHQHWVPQFYLRYFATPESRDSKTPQVWIFSKDHDDGDEQLTSVRNVCGKRYLYSPLHSDGIRDWSLDDRLTEVEGLLAPVWPSLAKDFVDLSQEHIRKALALFVSITHMRHPDSRKAIERLHTILVDFFESGPMEADGTPMIESVELRGEARPFDTSKWREYKSQGKDGHDRAFTKMIESEVGSMAKRLLEKRWSILLSDRDTFVSSDKPVVLSHANRECYGYGTKGVTIFFPLSPSRLLVMDDLHDEPANQYYGLLPTNASAVNMTIWRSTSRFLITGRPVPEVLSEINSLAGTSEA